MTKLILDADSGPVPKIGTAEANACELIPEETSPAEKRLVALDLAVTVEPTPILSEILLIERVGVTSGDYKTETKLITNY